MMMTNVDGDIDKGCHSCLLQKLRNQRRSQEGQFMYYVLTTTADRKRNSEL